MAGISLALVSAIALGAAAAGGLAGATFGDQFKDGVAGIFSGSRDGASIKPIPAHYRGRGGYAGKGTYPCDAEMWGRGRWFERQGCADIPMRRPGVMGPGGGYGPGGDAAPDEFEPDDRYGPSAGGEAAPDEFEGDDGYGPPPGMMIPPRRVPRGGYGPGYSPRPGIMVPPGMVPGGDYGPGGRRYHRGGDDWDAEGWRFHHRGGRGRDWNHDRGCRDDAGGRFKAAPDLETVGDRESR